VTGQQHAETETSTAVGHYLAVEAIFRIRDCDHGGRNARPGDVLDHAVQRGRAILSERVIRPEENEQSENAN
jgi:hypothetical protein